MIFKSINVVNLSKSYRRALRSEICKVPNSRENAEGLIDNSTSFQQGLSSYRPPGASEEKTPQRSPQGAMRENRGTRLLIIETAAFQLDPVLWSEGFSNLRGLK